MNAADTIKRKNKKSNKAPFTREEDLLILSLADKNYNYKEIVNHLKGRSPKQVRERLTFLKGHHEKATWDKNNDNLLREKVNIFGKNWTIIAPFFYPWPIDYIKSRWESIQLKYSENDTEFVGLDSTMPTKCEPPTVIEAVPQEKNFTTTKINYNICSNYNPQDGVAPSLPNPSFKSFIKQFIDAMNEGSSRKVYKASKTEYTEILQDVKVKINVPSSFSNSSGICYDVIDLMNIGSSCVTAKIKKTDSQESCYEAAKIIPKEYIEKTHSENLIQKEIAFLKILSRYSEQFNIIQYHDDFEYSDEFGKEYIVIVTEICSNGDLTSIKEEEFAEKINLKKTMFDIAIAIQFLHHNGISHLDIKLENVLAGEFIEDNYRIKLCDFGLSNIGLSKINSRAGTFFYQGPEFFDQDEIDPFKADIFSLGILFYLLTEQDNPFFDKDDRSIVSQKRIGRYLFDPKNNFHDLIERCLDPDPTKRPTIDDVISFLTEDN